MSCTHCNKETDEKYIIDVAGCYYCSEECIENYQVHNSVSFDDEHPYEDTYLILRHNYIELIGQWEDELNQKNGYLESKVDELLEEIDELINDHAGFINSEGDDGPYAWEIYQYTLKLRELQRRIFNWRPNRKMLYWVDGTSDDYRMSDIEQRGIYDRINTDLYLDGHEDFIYYVTKHYQHPWHWGLNYVFDDAEMAQEAFEIFKPYCEKHGVDLSIIESYKCEGSCGDVLETDANTYINGWFYCYSCENSGKYGLFTLQELEGELQYYKNNEEERQVVIYERMDWCYWYKKKIKRTCRAYEIGVPAWAV